MRYKVLFVKLDKLSPKGSQAGFDKKDLLVKGPGPKLQDPEGMLLLENHQDKLVERKNAINKMVRRLSDGYTDNKQDRPQYPSIRVRPTFILKGVPDSTTADLPQSIEPASFKESISASKKASLPEHGPRLSDKIESEKIVTKPEIPAQHPLKVTKAPPKPVHANRSSQTTNDDKDFEIPLEESLKAVQDFIKREKELAKWEVGEYVLAQWKGNALYYKAKILEIYISGTIVVLFDSYDIKDQIDYRDMCKYCRKTRNYIQKKGSRKETEKTKTDNKIICVKKRKDKRLRKTPHNRSHVTSFKRSVLLRKKILRTYQKLHEQKLQLNGSASKVLNTNC